MAFTEFCCRSGGSNLNAGTRTGSSTVPGTAADFTYTSGTWVQSTRTFTRLDAGSFITDGMTTSDFISVYPDAATVSPYIAKLTTVTATTFVTSSTVKSGTAPVDGTANTSAKLGGAWKGPNALEDFPFDFVTTPMNDGTNLMPRVNFMNNAIYSITGNIVQSVAGPIVWQGFTSAYGDLGRATIDGTISGASYIMLNVTGAFNPIVDFIFTNNGTTGAPNGALQLNVAGAYALRCVAHNVRGPGFVSFNNSTFEECEAYACQQDNGSQGSGFNPSGSAVILIRCIAHDNAGSNVAGFKTSGSATLIDCISDTNGQYGFNVGSGAVVNFIGCDSYNNVSDGFRNSSNSTEVLVFENCNAIKNGGWGINDAGSAGPRIGQIINCGFGVGTQANSSGTINAFPGLFQVGNINYPTGVTPWVDPANGDFRINLAQAINAGRGVFTETAASYAGTVGYPDIGAAQHLEVLSHGSGIIAGTLII